MGKNLLVNLKRIAFEIAQLISSNKKLINLIYNDKSDALVNPISASNLPSFANLVEDKYICFCAPNFANVETLNRNTFITILMEDFDFNSERSFINGSGAIHVTTNESHFSLDNGVNRSLEIIDEIIATIDGAKFSSAGTLEAERVNYSGFNEDYFNYRISFSISDEITRGVEI